MGHEHLQGVEDIIQPTTLNNINTRCRFTQYGKRHNQCSSSFQILPISSEVELLSLFPEHISSPPILACIFSYFTLAPLTADWHFEGTASHRPKDGSQHNWLVYQVSSGNQHLVQQHQLPAPGKKGRSLSPAAPVQSASFYQQTCCILSLKRSQATSGKLQEKRPDD